jgi:acyl-CoA reductase-like NAD-dependent aldehyde dehydrogenase
MVPTQKSPTQKSASMLERSHWAFRWLLNGVPTPGRVEHVMSCNSMLRNHPITPQVAQIARHAHLSVAAEAACVAACRAHHAWSEGQVREPHQLTRKVGAQIPAQRTKWSSSSSSSRSEEPISSRRGWCADPYTNNE